MDAPVNPRSDVDAAVQGSPGAVAAAALHLAGWSGASLVTAVAIAKAESGWNPSAHNTSNSNGTEDFGLMQINSIHNPSADQKTNPFSNARKAYQIYTQAGKSFRPWSTYNNNTYVKFLPDARKAVAELSRLGPEWERTRGKIGAGATSLNAAATAANPAAGLDSGLNGLASTIGRSLDSFIGVVVALALVILGIVLLSRSSVYSGAAKAIGRVTRGRS